MSDQPRDTEPHAPEAKVHHEPTAAHTDDPAAIEHARAAAGAGGQADEHVTDHGDGHGDGHGEVSLGPVDWGGWAYAVLGVVVALLVVAAFWLAIA